MNPPSDTPAWLPPLIPIAVLCVFIGMWCAACLFISATGGWKRLAERFATQQPPEGRRFSMQSGRMGWVNYNLCLTIHASPAGLHLKPWPMFRLGHEPLLIPWNEIHDARPGRLFSAHRVSFQIGSPSLAQMQLAKKVFEGQPVAIA